MTAGSIFSSAGRSHVPPSGWLLLNTYADPRGALFFCGWSCLVAYAEQACRETIEGERFA